MSTLRSRLRPHPPTTEPIIIVGAARSGTKLLRSLIASHPDVAEIPYDINFVWKYDNYDLPHDELSDAHLTPRAEAYIRAYFGRVMRRRPGLLVEKTVSNTLRVPFVRKVFPDCRIVHLIRDGRDVATSARRMWQAPMDVASVLKKLRGFPIRAVPRYGTAYLRSYLHRLSTTRGHVQTWGPRFDGIDEITKTHPLLLTCGLQWQTCVQRASAALDAVPRDRWIEVRYEALIEHPQQECERLFRFLGLAMTRECVTFVRSSVKPHNRGKWMHAIPVHEQHALFETIGPTLARLGYLPGEAQ